MKAFTTFRPRVDRTAVNEVARSCRIEASPYGRGGTKGDGEGKYTLIKNKETLSPDKVGSSPIGRASNK